MTRSLHEHSTETFPGHTGNFGADGEIPPIVETTDGHTTAERLNSVTELLASIAEQSDLPRDNEGLYRIGDSGEYIAVGRERDVTNDGTPADISRLRVVNPTIRFNYLGSRVGTGSHSVVDFIVHEESDGATRYAEFSESNGDQLPADAAGVSRQLVETMVEFAVSKRGEISDEILSDIIKPLTTPEASHDQTKVLGSAVVGRLLSKVGLHRAA